MEREHGGSFIKIYRLSRVIYAIILFAVHFSRDASTVYSLYIVKRYTGRTKSLAKLTSPNHSYYATLPNRTTYLWKVNILIYTKRWYEVLHISMIRQAPIRYLIQLCMTAYLPTYILLAFY